MTEMKSKSRSQNQKRAARGQGGEFVRVTLTLPRELEPFMENEVARPEHAGNRSSFVRSLIIEHRARRSQAA